MCLENDTVKINGEVCAAGGTDVAPSFLGQIWLCYLDQNVKNN